MGVQTPGVDDRNVRLGSSRSPASTSRSNLMRRRPDSLIDDSVTVGTREALTGPSLPSNNGRGLVDTSERSWQWWQTAMTPSSSDAGRLCLVARAVGHLRFALSPQGIIDWFRRPHPTLDGRSPHEVLHAESAGAERIARLAAMVRVTVAT